MCQIQPARRRRGPGQGPVAGVKDGRDILRQHLSLRRIQHRAGDGTYHIIQKTIGADLQLQQVAVAGDMAVVNGPHGTLDVGAHAADRREIMGPLEHPGRPVHQLFIQFLGVEIGPVHIEGVFDPGVIDAIGILFAQAGADGVKVLRHLIGRLHHNILRDMGVYGKGQPVHWDPGVGVEIGHIVLGVDTGIGAAAAHHLDLLSADHAETTLQRLRHGGLRLLDLPAVVGRAVIH